MGYSVVCVIKSFRHKGLAELLESESARNVQAKHAARDGNPAVFFAPQDPERGVGAGVRLREDRRNIMEVRFWPPAADGAPVTNGMDAPILLIGIDVPKWRCE
jgi:hypothetical protein